MAMPGDSNAPWTLRLEVFSDGVLAIAITLLILEVRVPEVGPGGLWSALGHLWPSYSAYVVSFATIGIMWVNHHAMFEHIARIDRGLLYLNLALLSAIAFLPFPTAVLAQYVRGDQANARAAAVLYGTTMIVIGICFTAMLAYLGRHRELLTPDVKPAALARARLQSAFGPAVYLVAISVALVAPAIAIAIFGIVAVFFALARHERPEDSLPEVT
jgi:uncharacterized membrane protein